MTKKHDVLPVGAVVIFAHEERRAKMVVVAVSPPPKRDEDTLYMLAENPISQPTDWALYSLPSLVYRVHAGWTAGNVDRDLLTDTGERVKVRCITKEPSFKSQAWMQDPTDRDWETREGRL